MKAALETCRKLVNEASIEAELNNFRKQNCGAFEATEENKLEYTTLHEEFINLVDAALTKALDERLGPGFDMAAFLGALPAFVASGASKDAEDDAGDDDEFYRSATLPATLDVLNRFTSFEAFKADMLAAKRAKSEEAATMAEGMALYFSVAQPRQALRR